MQLGTRLEYVRGYWELARMTQDFTEGIEKIAKNTSGDRRRRTVRLTARNAGGCWIMGVRSLSLVVISDRNP
ncbi:hypothetical protein B296_00028326 [Ensete ventricosum]|uniref:Uncharacterized protein n=1 Tax=Ensete ventricosum TaxID=4639 RepID=A0A426YTG1_ENSVE|nr:hypothetical protein B296_00028326 [Ensete ventricosum]